MCIYIYSIRYYPPSPSPSRRYTHAPASLQTLAMSAPANPGVRAAILLATSSCFKPVLGCTKQKQQLWNGDIRIPHHNVEHPLRNHGGVENVDIIGTMQLGCFILGGWDDFSGHGTVYGISQFMALLRKITLMLSHGILTDFGVPNSQIQI